LKQTRLLAQNLYHLSLRAKEYNESGDVCCKLVPARIGGLFHDRKRHLPHSEHHPSPKMSGYDPPPRAPVAGGRGPFFTGHRPPATGICFCHRHPLLVILEFNTE